MTMDTIRRLAADIFGVGRRRVWISPEGSEETKKLATRADVRDLISKGVVKKLPVSGRKKKKKPKRSFSGSKKGNVAKVKKRAWMTKVRAQRKLLVKLIGDSVLGKDNKRSVYNKIKSGLFRNKKAMITYLKENKTISSDFDLKSSEKPKKVTKSKSVKKQTKKKVKKQEGESK